MTSKSRAGLWLLLLSAPAILWGCPSERVDPVVSDQGAGASRPDDPQPPHKRTVEERNLWGGPEGNLLVDGDFEFSILIEGLGAQTGWFAFSNVDQEYLQGETGAVCRTGLRCAVLKAGHILYGQGTSARGTGMIARFSARVPDRSSCEAVEPALIRCSLVGNVAPLPPVNEQPDADGWCEYAGRLEEQSSATCLYVDNSLEDEQLGLVDSAVLLPDDGSAPLSTPAVPRVEMKPVSGERAARLSWVIDQVKKRRRFGKPTPPSEGTDSAARLPLW